MSWYALIRSALLKCEVYVAMTFTADTSGDANSAFSSSGEWDVRVHIVPCVGLSVAGWQFMQRGLVITLAISLKIARERTARS